MPEIVDLEIFRTNLEKHYKGRKLSGVKVGARTKVEASEEALNKALAGQKLAHIGRHAKELYFDFGKNAVVSMHLMLHGQLGMPEKLPDNFIMVFEFEQVKPLVLSDYQRAAKITLNPGKNKVVDALSKEMTPDWLVGQLSKKRSAIKTVITDPKVIGGIGNAYADEILWAAKIHPGSVANKIPENAVRRLAKSIPDVIEDAIKTIRKDHPDIISGEIRDFMAVHNHRRKESPTGGKIEVGTIGSRKTYFTDEQELFN